MLICSHQMFEFIHNFRQIKQIISFLRKKYFFFYQNLVIYKMLNLKLKFISNQLKIRQKMNRKVINLPELLKDQIVTSYAQIRPYRKGGFRIQKQTIKNKDIYHNYGHGGSGVSWSYGSAVRIINLLQNSSKKPENSCAVIGSGVIGLLTALELTNRKYKVKIYSKRIPIFSQKDNNKLITSQIAPGFWFPYDYLDLPHLKSDQLSQVTMNFLKKSIQEKKYSALKYCKTYDQIYDTKIIEKFKNVLISQNQKTLLNFGNGKYQEFNEFSTVRIDMQRWLKELIEELKSKDIQFINYQFNSLNQVLQLKENNIFNCTGYGSKYLFEDNKMQAMRGHIVEFNNPNPQTYNYIFGTKFNDEIIRIYGHESRILLGLTKEQNQICQVDQNIVDRMIQNYQQFFNKWVIPIPNL